MRARLHTVGALGSHTPLRHKGAGPAYTSRLLSLLTAVATMIAVHTI